jgi:hypothetical protein
MTERDHARHQEPDERTLHDETAAPEQTVDALEEQVLGGRHDQRREQAGDATAGVEPP